MLITFKFLCYAVRISFQDGNVPLSLEDSLIRTEAGIVSVSLEPLSWRESILLLFVLLTIFDLTLVSGLEGCSLLTYSDLNSKLIKQALH